MKIDVEQGDEEGDDYCPVEVDGRRWEYWWERAYVSEDG